MGGNERKDMDAAKRNKLLLLILYLSFVSLGLPDAVLGSAWPNMRHSFGRSLEAAGILQSLTTILSVVSSLAAGWLLARWNTGMLITVCAFMTGGAMFGYAFSPAFVSLLFFTVFFGLGQGAVDTAVNSYMAKHYSVKHMNWVHCCWGIGATAGPFIMTSVFALDYSWRTGYLVIALVQSALAITFLLSLGMWEKDERPTAASKPVRPSQVLRLRFGGLSKSRFYITSVCGMLFYFLYAGVELVTGLWSASYLVDVLGASPAAAAISVTMFWAAVALGRFVIGFVAHKASSAAILRLSMVTALAGCVIFLVSTNLHLCRIAMLLIGFGIAPLYPTMMHDTPARIGKKGADKVVGLQVGAALAGNTVIPLAFGYVAQAWTLELFGPATVLFACLIFIMHEISLRFSLLGKPVDNS